MVRKTSTTYTGVPFDADPSSQASPGSTVSFPQLVGVSTKPRPKPPTVPMPTICPESLIAAAELSVQPETLGMTVLRSVITPSAARAAW
jgi:hypothetical protein